MGNKQKRRLSRESPTLEFKRDSIGNLHASFRIRRTNETAKSDQTLICQLHHSKPVPPGIGGDRSVKSRQKRFRDFGTRQKFSHPGGNTDSELTRVNVSAREQRAEMIRRVCEEPDPLQWHYAFVDFCSR
jgi:hypothetical protein